MADEAAVMLRIGVLAIQGAFFEHRASLLRAKNTLTSKVPVKLEILDVRDPEQLNDLDGLILPGGESTTMSIFLKSNNFEEVLKEWVKSRGQDRLVWGTCAGLILLSNEIDGQKLGGQTKVSSCVLHLLVFVNCRIPPTSLKYARQPETHLSRTFNMHTC